MFNLADLPNDIDALKAMLLSQQQVVVGLTEQLNTRAVEIEHLKRQIVKSRRKRFGRESEKLDHQIEQLELQLEDMQADEGEAAREMPAADQAPRKKSGRRPLPDHLPRDEKMYPPLGEAYPACGGGLHPLGENVADHLPLYRQSVIHAREGVELERALLANWVGGASALLRPQVDGIRRHVLAGTKLYADDTPILVLAAGPMARPKQRGCGPTCVTIALAATPRQRRSGLPTRRTAKASIRKLIWPTSRACRRPTHMPVSTHSTSMTRYRKRRARHMRAASSTICMQPDHRPSRPRPCAGSPSCM